MIFLKIRLTVVHLIKIKKKTEIILPFCTIFMYTTYVKSSEISKSKYVLSIIHSVYSTCVQYVGLFFRDHFNNFLNANNYCLIDVLFKM